VTTPAPLTDGRSARSQRTREAVVDALLALIGDGNPRPTAREIAERANVSLRSVYVHFDDLEDLFLAVAQRQMAQVVTMVTPISPDAPLADRIEAMCTQRCGAPRSCRRRRHRRCRTC
jgi:TetR/AcrR family transcriptional regulator, regulator of autoinduction and epiphytic fitness